MLGVQDSLSVETVWALGAALGLAAVTALVMGGRRFRMPGRQDALDRLDARLAGRPLQTLRDSQAIGGGDAASRSVWEAHQARMADRAAAAQAVAPDLRVSDRDPYALRYVAVLALSVALLFGSFLRVGSVAEMTPGGAALADGPVWEGWIEPPAYTGLPSLYLADQPAGKLEIAEGSRITLRLYGQVGALTVTESVSGRSPTDDQPGAEEPSRSFDAVQAGELSIGGPGGRSWDITLIGDMPPAVETTDDITTAALGEMSLPFEARDDYGIRAGEAVISLDMAALDRRYGLQRDPEPRDRITVPLPMPVAGDRANFNETLIEDFSKHPWANLPVRIELRVSDDPGQQSAPETLNVPLPGRRFFDPLAAAIIEQRQALLWTRENAADVIMVLRALVNRPDDIFRSATTYLRMRTIQRRLELFADHGLTEAQRDEIAEAMWNLAVLLEDGDLDDARERLKRAQERLSEAIKNGASDQEIAELMQELREATQDYMRQLAQEQRRNGEQNPEMAQNPENMMEMTQDDLQAMMDRIQELMEQGRMAEAEQALRELQDMMENMQVTQGQQGQGQQSPGEQAMEGLAETLREQQGLSDQAFRDLQEQFNPGANQGQSQGNEGRNGGQGRGRNHEGQPGQGQGQGEQQGRPGQQQGDQQGAQQGQRGALADRQEALRRELERQRGAMPGQGSEAGRRAQDSLEEAERAMEGAEQALRGDDLPEAIDRQSEAMEALREGMRNLGEALAEQQRQQGQQGDTAGAQSPEQRDPLGREAGNTGSISSNENLLQGEDVYRRARELLDEIRRRSGDGARPEIERNYLERLLDRF